MVSASPFVSPPREPNSADHPSSGISASGLSLVLGMATAPLLASLVATRWWMTWVEQVGDASIEIFRGDRLPLLKQSSPNSAAVSPNSSPTVPAVQVTPSTIL